MGPEVVWDSQVKKKKKKEEERKKEKKNPGDAVVAWENKQLPRQLKRKTPIGRQVRKRLRDFTAALGKTIRRF